MKYKMKRLYIISFTSIILCLVCGWQFAGTQLAENDLTLPTPAPAAGVQQQPQISKGTNSSLVVWSDSRTSIVRAPEYASDGQGGGFDIYAARYDASGNLIDTAPIIVSEMLYDQSLPSVAWNGQNWLVVWRTPRLNNQYDVDLVGVRVSPAGKILDAAPIVIGASEVSDGANYLSAASDGVNWVVTWGSGGYESKIRAARIAPSGAVIDAGGGKVLFDDAGLFTAPSNAKLAFAGNQFLLVWDRLTSGGGYGIRGQRFNQNLEAIDAEPFAVDLIDGSADSPRVATDGTNFLVVWREGGSQSSYDQIYAARVSAAGQVLDPNGILLYTVNTNYTSYLGTALCFDGTNYVAAYHARPNNAESIYASRISPNGTVLTPNPIVVSDTASLQPAIAPLAGGVSQIVWTDSRLSNDTTTGLFRNSDIFGARLLADGTTSAPAPVSLGAPRETQPHLVFTTGGNFASVFRSTVSGASSIFIQRFDAGGSAIDANPILVASGTENVKNPSVAWNGTDYLVVWELDTQIFGRRVAADGTLIGTEFAIMPGNQPDVAALGAQFLVVDDYEPTDHIRFAQSIRVDANGTVLGAPLKIGSNYDLRPRVRAFGARWLAVWESDISHDNRNSNIQAAFINADGTSTGEFAVSGSGADTPSFAVAGDTALIVWAGAQSKIYGRRIQADGSLLDTGQGLVLASAPQPLYAPSAAWDGSRFIVAYNDSRNRSLEPPDDVWATLVGLDGAVLTTGGFPVSKVSTPEEHPTVEASNGKAIFGYALFDAKAPYSNYRIKLRKFPFDQSYFLAVTPYSRTAAPGASVTYQISVTAQNGFSAPVNLGIDDLPNGVTATFNPPTVTGSGTSVLTIAAAPDTPENIYRFTVTATGGTQQSSAEIVLYLDDNPPPTGFSVTNLGTLGGTESEARAINNNGQIVGYSFNASQKRRAFSYNNGQMSDLGTLGGADSEANDINDSGLIVGQAKNAAAKNRAFLYNGTSMQDLGTFGGEESYASSINNSNQITGAATIETGNYHAFRAQNNQLQDLGVLNGYYSYGRGINSAGKVVGFSYLDGSDGGVRGFLYQNSMTAIGTLGGRDSSATAINDSDQIVGSSAYLQNSGTQHAFLYSGGQMQDLGTLGAAQSFAEDINNAGQVVGSVELTLFGRDYRAFLYDGATMRNLNTLIPQDSGWILNQALGINNNGQIVGRGTVNSQTRAFLLSPLGIQNTPPTVAITSPTVNRRFDDVTAITVNASAFDADGAVVRVEFYADGNLIGTSTSNPFAILWTGMAQNHTYILTAKAIDDRGAVTVSAPVTITVGASQQVRQTPFDFDGDGKSDISIFRPSAGEWWYLKSSSGANYAAQFGASTDKPVPGDFTGDGKTDIAFWRPSTGEWFVLRSEDSSYYSFPFGVSGDIPVVGDFDADGKSDAAIYRPSDSTWYISKSSGGTTIHRFGQAGDVPVAADYDGDHKTDIAIYRVARGEWWINRSSLGLIAFQFGNSTDKPVVGDYTGDGKTDVAFFKPSTNEWFVLRSENQNYYSFPFGANGDIPAPGDYDGDGKFDATVFRPSANTWYSQRTTAGILIQSFGQTGDKPVPAAFVP